MATITEALSQAEALELEALKAVREIPAIARAMQPTLVTRAERFASQLTTLRETLQRLSTNNNQ